MITYPHRTGTLEADSISGMVRMLRQRGVKAHKVKSRRQGNRMTDCDPIGAIFQKGDRYYKIFIGDRKVRVNLNGAHGGAYGIETLDLMEVL